jgi:hypothetical protein
MSGSAATAIAAPLSDPERYSVTPTGWGYYFTADVATINTWATQYGMRIIDVEVVSPTLFTVLMVHNSGTYQRGLTAAASWTTNETVSSLLTKLSGKRLLDLERYLVDGQARFAAAMVDNPASNWHDYKWYPSATIAYITDRIDAFNGRIIDIDPVSPGRYAVVMVKNEGIDAKAWWWYPGQTPEEIGQLLKDNQARLVDIEPDGPGTFSVVMVASKGEYWLWYPALTEQQVIDIQAQSGMRLIHLKRYTTAANVLRYAAIYLDTLDAVSVKARQALWPAAGSATFGFYLKRVGGTVYNALQPDKKFEPASMLKALHHVHAMRAVRNGTASLGESITWYKSPGAPNDGGVCAYADDGTKLTSLPQTSTLQTVLQGMMEQSDNRKTDAVYDRFGPGAINATADWLGMTKTQLNHRIGCTWAAPGQVAAPNELTLADDARLFEAVYRVSNPVLGTGFYRDKFTELMATGLSRSSPRPRLPSASRPRSRARSTSRCGARTSRAGTPTPLRAPPVTPPAARLCCCGTPAAVGFPCPSSRTTRRCTGTSCMASSSTGCSTAVPETARTALRRATPSARRKPRHSRKCCGRTSRRR